MGESRKTGGEPLLMPDGNEKEGGDGCDAPLRFSAEDGPSESYLTVFFGTFLSACPRMEDVLPCSGQGDGGMNQPGKGIRFRARILLSSPWPWETVSPVGRSSPGFMP